MALTNSSVGAPISITVGRRGEQPDVYPARLVGVPFHMLQPSGRAAIMAPVIALQTTLAGEPYLSERVQNLAFASDRRVRCVQLDGTGDAPLTWQALIAAKAAATLAYFTSRQPQSVNLDDLEDPEPAAAPKKGRKAALVTA
jgi:hypothetical protein